MKKSIGAKALAVALPVWLVGSYDRTGRPNLMAAAWCGVCCSDPPCVAVSIRKTRLSHANVYQRKAFTINVPPEEYLAEADFAGIVSGKGTDKFFAAGLTPVRGQFVDAPYVEEFPVVLECKVKRIIRVGSHTQFIGEIADVKADSSVLDDYDRLRTELVKPVICSTADRMYYSLGKCLGSTYFAGQKFKK